MARRIVSHRAGTIVQQIGEATEAQIDARVVAKIADDETVVQAAAAAVENNPTFLAQEERVDRVDPGAVGGDGTAIVYEASVPHARRLGFWDVDWSGATSYPDGTSYAAMTDSSAAINAAVTKAKALGVPVVGRGTYRVDSTVTLDTDFDFTRATFVAGITTLAPVVRVGADASATITAIRGVAPSVVQSAHIKGAGWGTDTGIELRNCRVGEVWVQQVVGFDKGVWMTADAGRGCVHNHVHVQNVLNCKEQFLVEAADPTGWVNSNNIYGGDYQHNSSEGTSVAGVRHIAIRGGGDNKFWGPSIEGQAPEYHVEFTASEYNLIDSPRFEGNVAGNKVLMDASFRDRIIGSSMGGPITYTITNGSAMMRVPFVDGEFWQYGSNAGEGGLVLANSSVGAMLTLMGASATPTTPITEYVAQFSRPGAGFKRETDTYNRLYINYRTPEITMGSGTAAPVKVLGTQRTGWTAATGTATRTTFDTSTVTTAQLAERLKALLDDLITHGLIGS